VFDYDPRLSAHPRALQPAAPINRDQERVFRFADGIGSDHTASCSLTPDIPGAADREIFLHKTGPPPGMKFIEPGV
jgi:hypothetical protein